jgi:quercetin dioxygenase-like cupin family protein
MWRHQALRAGFDCEESPKTKSVEESPQNCCIVPEIRKERIPMDYKFIADLLADVNVPTEGILSRVLQKDEHVNITLFGFSPGQELSTHSAPAPAVLYFLNGEADVTLGDDVHQAKTGSFAYMPPLLPHAIAAKSATMMLLVQIKLPKRAAA